MKHPCKRRCLQGLVEELPRRALELGVSTDVLCKFKGDAADRRAIGINPDAVVTDPQLGVRISHTHAALLTGSKGGLLRTIKTEEGLCGWPLFGYGLTLLGLPGGSPSLRGEKGRTTCGGGRNRTYDLRLSWAGDLPLIYTLGVRYMRRTAHLAQRPPHLLQTLP